MTIAPVDFASLMCSRLCHDLLSPVGAFNNGLELLAGETDPEMRERCIELLEQSAKSSADRLKFFRLAFGSAGGFGEAIATAEAHGVISGLIGEDARIELNWMVTQQELPKPVVKVMLNLVLVAIDALVRGGQLDVGVERRDDVCEIVVRAEGPKIAADSDILAALGGEVPDTGVTARNAAAWMTSELARAHKGQVQLGREANSLLMGAMLAV